MVCDANGTWLLYRADFPGAGAHAVWPGRLGDDDINWLICIPMCYLPEYNRVSSKLSSERNYPFQTEFDTYKIVEQRPYFEYGEYVDLYRDNKTLIYLPGGFTLGLQCQPSELNV